MPQIGPLELIIVLVIVVIVFGVGKLPEIGGALGRGIREFRGSVRDDTEETPKQVESKTKDVEAKPKSEA